MAALRCVFCVALLALQATNAASQPVSPEDGPHLVKRSPQPWKPHIHIHVNLPHVHLPHVRLPHIHIDMHKLKACVKGQLPRLPGAVGNAMMGCLPSAALGAPSFATCVAGNGVVSAARASQHIAVCMG